MKRNIKLIRQPARSHCCGQCCVAMAAGVSLEDAKKAVGKNGCTSTQVLRNGLIKLGMRPRGGKLKAIYGDLSKLPETCILKTVSPWRRLGGTGWHWVFKHGKKVYDPSRGLFMVAEYMEETYNHITSYLEIFTDGGPAPRPAPGGGSDDLIPQKGHVVAEHDPSGMDMTRDISDRQRLFEAYDCTVERIALNMDQIDKYDPPPNPARITDSRAAEYIAAYGSNSWELDALEPRVLSGLINNFLEV